MSKSGSVPRTLADRRSPAGPGLRSPSPLRELFAPLEQLLTCGGDARLAIDPGTGRNAYGCGPIPCPDIPAFSSCTASTISQRGYEAAESARTALMASALLHGLVECFDARIEAMRGELKTLLGLERSAAEVVFSASGTDAQLQALALTRALLGNELTTVIVAADQTGSGTVNTARGNHFGDRSTNDCKVSRGAPVSGLGPLSSVAVRLRDGNDRLRSPSAIDAEVLETVESLVAQGARVMLEVMDCSKFGYQAPSDRCTDEIAARWPGRVQIVVDACQMRLGRSRIARYLARGDLVLLTGSKYFAGPPFSGALLVPPQLGQAIGAMTELAPGIADYSSRSDWPMRWRGLRAQFSAAPNFGQWLRWEAALEEIRAYYAVPIAFRRAALRQLGDGIAKIIAGAPALRLLPPQPRPGHDDEFSDPSIFAFTVEPGGHPLSLAQCRAIYSALRDDRPGDTPVGAPAAPCLIGQPVGWGGRDDDAVAAMRICISARHVIDAWAAHPDLAHGALTRILDDAATAVANIQALLPQPDAIAKDFHAD
ncbi:hypothetical protein [Rhodopseudomonas pseudopalustris]|uniref:Selenocysteine lyase/Cysteine desulfurase n=2 Tax=Rhodopseudomonas pseudopalustris TaxID=1513892 RepID=A0A1H8LIA6_9BRAD|nr:hypothetical protein [Rhodopseudomonas pseudopalustris]SEO04789.1 hypothetical protein SAMN05444123_10186 [Rhodopseudomonas pseudopalustris]